MKLKQLSDILNKHLIDNPQSADYDIMIPVKVTGGMTMGPSPALNVNVCGEGFDWDSGKFFLFPEKETTITYKQYRTK